METSTGQEHRPSAAWEARAHLWGQTHNPQQTKAGAHRPKHQLQEGHSGFTNLHTLPSTRPEPVPGLLVPVCPATRRLLWKYLIYPFYQNKWGMTWHLPKISKMIWMCAHVCFSNIIWSVSSAFNYVCPDKWLGAQPYLLFHNKIKPAWYQQNVNRVY